MSRLLASFVCLLCFVWRFPVEHFRGFRRWPQRAQESQDRFVDFQFGSAVKRPQEQLADSSGVYCIAIRNRGAGRSLPRSRYGNTTSYSILALPLSVTASGITSWFASRVGLISPVRLPLVASP